MNENDQTQPSVRARRNFLAKAGRNALAIVAIAASATSARIKAAAAAHGGGDGGGHEGGGRGEGGGHETCFLKGTKIQTIAGERKVEDLAIGDLLPTVFGGERPIQWIGHYR